MTATKSFKVYLATGLLMACVFALDMITPLGVAGAVPYAGSIIATQTLRGRRVTLTFAVIGTLLTAGGFALSPPGGELWKVLLNRGLALLVLWSATLLILGHKRRSEELQAEYRANHLDGQMQRAFDLTDGEADVLRIVERALAYILPNKAAEILLGDSDRAGLQSVSPNEAQGCSVAQFSRCAALRRGTTLQFDGRDALDACQHLQPGASACIPISILGRHAGVLRAMSDQPLPERQITKLHKLAYHAGMRLGMLRTIADTQLQARTDPLTGLLNRRRFEEECLMKLRGGAQHVVALLDLDHFKQLNDAAGHEAGDRALTLFSEVLSAAARGGDRIARHGGEEFAVLLSDTNAEGAKNMLDRLRGKLAVATAQHPGPSFTVSAGLATFPKDGTDLQALLRVADRMLYEAKRLGRDCVVAPAEAEPAEAGPELPKVVPLDAELTDAA